MSEHIFKSDVLVIGTGVAGLSLSLYIDRKVSINLITKSDPEDSSTFNAQGGIACVTAVEDSFEEHIKDTITAGDGLCVKKVVETVVKDAPQRIADLKKWGVEFTGGCENPALGREGGHSRRRILHYEDRTGEEIGRKLLSSALSSDNTKLFSHHTVVNLIINKGRCRGAYILDNRTLKVKTFLSRITVLATGGCGKVYLYTSNPDVATGDGIAMAYRLRARIANMEFIQFHPTGLYSAKEGSFLITEAMRGEGAVLLNAKGERFMKKYDPREELAPRDIVARAIDSEMKKTGSKFLHLDIHSGHQPQFIKNRFPLIYSKLLSLGIDITRENIPIVPVAHYCCGGISVDDKGCTSIEGLMAVGECSFTGLHGANRLASNSLLESLVFGYRAARAVPGLISKVNIIDTKPWKYTGKRLPSEQIFIEYNWQALRRLMWSYVGVVRSDMRLAEALKRLKIIEREVDYYYWNYLLTPQLVEMRNLIDVSRIIIKCAMKRKESRGLHYNVDYPRKNPEFKKNTYIRK
ncbi:MAG: L-aspartate oxidase [Elusimicrobia bacterium]|nr:L-aspartate oxidase [Elusimicrobiota bacterium]